MKLNFLSVLVIFTLCGIGYSAAQSIQPYARLGMTQSEARKILGNPSFLYSVIFNRNFPFGQESSLLAVTDRVDDVWERKTAHNTFDVRASYNYDHTASRLHPTLRLSHLLFMPDKDELASAMLNEIGEAREMCKSGCQVYGTRDAGNYEMDVCRSAVPSENQLAIEAESGWTRTESDEVFLFCAEIHYRPIVSETRLPKPKDVDWKAHAVDYIEISAEQPSLLLRKRQDIYGLTGDFIIQLNDWRPN